MGTRILLFVSLFGTLIFASCTSSRKIAYFENAQDTTYFKQVLGTIEAPFQKNDILDVTISSLDSKASADFNKTEAVNPTTKGYLVNNDGNIQLPMLGNVQVAGLTKKQVKENITNMILAKKLLVEPMVEIRHLNFDVTVLGEVAHPSVINVPSEQISLIKALSLAGDMTIYGKRENVLLVREEGGVRKTRYINLSSSDFLNSQYYYLKPNDLIYVEPSKAKVASSGWGMQVLPLAITTVSFLFLVLDRVIK
jgi:polysaccharide biosynthesis/export protein